MDHISFRKKVARDAEQEFNAQHGDHDEGASLEEMVALHELHKALRREAHGEDTEKDSGADKDQLGRHREIFHIGDCGDDVVDGERQVHDLHRDDRSPEWSQQADRAAVKYVALRFYRLVSLLDHGFVPREMRPCEPQKIEPAERLEPPDGDEPGGEREADSTKDVSADDAISQRFSTLVFRETHHHRSKHGGIVH